MNQQAAAIIIAGALIAGAIALTNHWSLNGDGSLRLNRWTGTIVLCVPKAQLTKAADFEVICAPTLPPK